MLIQSLELENIKSYEHARIDFSEGVNAIVGHNGAGKSTVLEAIGYALFGELGYRIQDFVREGAKSGRVAATFLSDHDERSYRVVRRLGSVSAWLVEDPEMGVKLCEGRDDVPAFLRRHMGVDEGTDLGRLFKDAVGVPQGLFTAAFLQTPEQRKGTFDPLLKVEEYKSAFERLREPAALLKERQRQLDTELANLAGRLARLPDLQSAVAERAAELDSIRAELNEVTPQLEEARRRRAALDGVRRKLMALQNQYAATGERVRALEQQVRQAQSQVAEAEQAAGMVRDSQAGARAYEAAQAEQHTLEQQFRRRQELRDRRQELEKERALVERELAAVKLAQQEVAEAEVKAAGLAEAVAEQQRLEAALAAAQQLSARLEDARSAMRQREAELARGQQRAAALEAELQRAAALDAEQNAAEAARAEAAAQLAKLGGEKTAAGERAEGLKEQIEELEKLGEAARCPVCEQPLTPKHRQDLIARNQSRLRELRTRWAEANRAEKDAEKRREEQESVLRRVQAARLKLPRSQDLDEARANLLQVQAQLDADIERTAQWADAPAQAERARQELAALGNPAQQQAVALSTAQRKPRLEADAQRFERQAQAIRRQMEDVDGALTEFAELDGRFQTVRAALEEHAAAHQTVLTYRRQAESLAARQAALKKLVQQQQIAEAEHQTAVTEMAQVEQEFDQSDYEQAVADERTADTRQAALSTKLDYLASAQAAAQAEMEELLILQEKRAELDERKAQLGRRERVLTDLRNLIKEAGPYITQLLIQQISEGAAQIFGDIMQDYSRRLSWTQDYSIQLQVNSVERQFAQLSGGEQMSAALAVRLALLREMSNIDVAFFDEPTTNLDEARRSALAQQIVHVKGLRQLIVISHDDAFEQSTQHLIRVVRTGGASRVTVGENGAQEDDVDQPIEA